MNKINLPGFVRNFYFITAFVFVIWILFFDANDMITQYGRSQKLKKLEQDKKYYTKEIKELKKELKKLSESSRKLEKFAREKYYLKKPKEDVYVIVEAEDSLKNGQ